MTRSRSAVDTEPRRAPEPTPPTPQDTPAPAPRWRRLADAVVAGHRADVPF